MRVVVTGVAGFVGYHTANTLLERDYKVAGIDVKPASDLTIAHPNFSYFQEDILSPNISNIIDRGDAVLHLAAVAKFRDAEENPQRAIRVNVEGTLNIVQACIEKGASRIVYSSTGSVYALNAPVPIREDAPRLPSSIYGLSKKMAEDIIFFHTNKLPHVILRYGYIFGPQKTWGAVGAFIDRISHGEPPVVFGGEQSNDFTYIEDIVQANILALETEYTNQAYNIGAGRPVSILDVCEMCLEAMNSNLKPIIKPSRSFDYKVFYYDIDKAKKLLGFEPKWNLHNGIKDMITRLNLGG